MKKIILILFVICCFNYSFCQKDGVGKTKWSPYEKAAPCFPNLYISLKSCGWVASIQKYCYNFKLKNTSSKHLHFNLDIRFSSGEDYTADGRFDLGPGKELVHVSMYYDTVPVANTVGFFSSSVTAYIENDGGDDWTVPQYICQNGTAVCDHNCENNSNSSSNSGSNNALTDNSNESLQNAIDEFNSLMNQVPDDNERTTIYNRVESVLANKTTPESIKLKEVNAAIVKFKNKLKQDTTADDAKSAQAEQLRKEEAEQKRKEDAAQKEADRLQKIKDDKRKSFDSNIASGDSALQAKNYDSALSYYSSAQNYADNSSELAFAKSKYNKAFEARRDAEREVRVAKAKKNDELENAQYAGTTAAMIGAMALLQDSYSDDPFVFKLFLGLGVESSPLLSNNISKYSPNKTFIESRFLPTFDIGTKFELLNNHSISFFLKPQLTYGLSALNVGTSGGFLSYGGIGCLNLSYHYDSLLSLFVDGGWFRKSSTFEYDADAAANGSTKTDDVRSGEYNYTSIRYGGGLMLRGATDDDQETYLRAGFFYEKPDFFTPIVKPILNLSLQLNIRSELIIELNYAKNTFIPGDPKYPSTVIPEDKIFWGIKLIRQGNLNNL